MEEDQRFEASAEGINSFMNRVNHFLHLHIAQKSEEYDLNFRTGLPSPNPQRYMWESVHEAPLRPSVSSLATASTVEALTLPTLEARPSSSTVDLTKDYSEEDSEEEAAPSS